MAGGVCSIPGVSLVCGGVGDIVSSATNSILDGMAKTLSDGLATMLKMVTTFWTGVPTPSFSSSGPILLIQSDLFWLQGILVVFALLYAAGQMAMTRSGKPAGEAAKALGMTLLVTGAGLAALDAVTSAGDSFATWIINQSTGGDLANRLGALAAAGSVTGSDGLIIVLAILGIISSLVQVALLLARIGVLAVVAGALPVTSAMTNTQTGRAWFQRMLGWLIAFAVYKPVAALIYASAFYLIGDGTDLTSIISGLILLTLAVLALPALLKLITPAVSGAMNGGGGALALAAGGALATGARMVADRSSSGGDGGGSSRAGLASSAPAGARAAGASGASSAGASGAGAASAAAGPAAIVLEVAKAGHAAAQGAAAHASSGAE